MSSSIDRERLLNELHEAAASVASRISTGDEAFDSRLREMYLKCFMDTAERTVLLPGMTTTDAAGHEKTVSDEVFVITGDINAMWLRDSSAQVVHYLPFAGRYPEIRKMIASLIRRHQMCIARDPYANSYLEWPEAETRWADDISGMVAGDWERKYETDSLSYHIWLVKRYIEETGDISILDEAEFDTLTAILDTWERETHHDGQSEYFFERRGHDKGSSLADHGRGTPIEYTGMTWSGFRPSDDPCVYGFNIPENLFASKVLEYVEEFAGMYGAAFGDKLHASLELAERAERLRESIRRGIYENGTVEDPNFGEIYAYETDGMGHTLCMDDANVPSLLALPWLRVCEKDDPLYLRTRSFILSKSNPFYYEGSVAAGVGSPHTYPEYIWPIGLVMQGMTSTDPAEREKMLRTLMATDAGCLAMHESFDTSDPTKFTRVWFAWADSLFASYIAELF